MVAIVKNSALEFWLKGMERFLGDSVSELRISRIPAKQRSSGIPYDELEDFISRTGLKLPVHIASESFLQRTKRDIYIWHTSVRGDLPGAYVQISENILISSPELTFIQVADDYSLAGAVRLADNLCATYYIDPAAEYLQEKRVPVTNAAAMRKFADRADNLNGIKAARRALKYALDNSNSPLETNLAVIARLPLSEGGFNALLMELNGLIKLSASGMRHIGRKSIRCDMVWRTVKVALEYESTLTHLELNQHYYDKARYTALTYSGYKVITVTAQQLRSYTSIDNLFFSVRKMLGMRPEKAAFEKYRDKRRQVMNELFFSSRV